jgi:hypothetical protein
MMEREEAQETHRLNKIILIEEINQLHSNGILLVFNVRCDVTYELRRFAVRNYILHWLCTSELVLKQHRCFPYSVMIVPYESSTFHDPQ